MSLEAIRWSKAQRTGSPTAKAVLFALAEAANREGRCFISQAEIAEVTELSRRAIVAQLQLLEKMGLIEREHRHRKDGSRTSDSYQLAVPSQSAPDAHRPDQSARGAQREANQSARGAPPVPTVLEPTEIPPLSPKGENTPEEEQEPEPKRRPFTLPPDWTPNEKHAEIARSRGVDLRLEADKLRDWATAGGKKYLDWDATFRNWLRNAKPERGGPRGAASREIFLRPHEVEQRPPQKTRMQIEHEERQRQAREIA